jgi:hypothetical protein
MGEEPWLNYIMNISYTKHSIQIKESDEFIEKYAEIGTHAERLFGKKELIF